MIETIRGDLIQALSKGFMHKLGNLANGLGVNLQVLSKIGLKQDKSEDFFQRLTQNNQGLTELIGFMRYLFLGKLTPVDDCYWEKIKEFLVYNLMHEKERKFEVNWDSVRLPCFRILIPVIIFQELQNSSGCMELRIEENAEGILCVSFQHQKPSPEILNYLKEKKFVFQVHKHNIEIMAIKDC